MECLRSKLQRYQHKYTYEAGFSSIKETRQQSLLLDFFMALNSCSVCTEHISIDCRGQHFYWKSLSQVRPDKNVKERLHIRKFVLLDTVLDKSVEVWRHLKV